MQAATESTVTRLLGALEDLVAQETALLAAGYYRDAIAIQRRAAPVVARLCELGSMPGAATVAIRRRVSALLSRRGQSLATLLGRRLTLNAERQRLREARLRLRQVSGYSRYTRGPGRKSSTRLNAAV
jgi:hypothetical protein